MTVRVPGRCDTLEGNVVVGPARLVHGGGSGPSMATMKKLLMLAALGTLVAVAVKKVRSI